MSRPRHRRAQRAPQHPRHIDSPELHPGAGHRGARLQHILGGELQSLLRDEASDPLLGSIRVLDVVVSPDAGHARIAYAVAREEPRAVQRALTRADAFLRSRLCERLSLKRTPRLTFTFVGVDDGPGGAP